eukprot:602597-Hanusia_phi.AAC.1
MLNKQKPGTTYRLKENPLLDLADRDVENIAELMPIPQYSGRRKPWKVRGRAGGGEEGAIREGRRWSRGQKKARNGEEERGGRESDGTRKEGEERGGQTLDGRSEDKSIDEDGRC